MRRARLLRYSPYQLKDFAIERAITVVFLAAVNLIGPITTMHGLPPAVRAGGPNSPMAGQIIVIFGSLIILAVLFSAMEIVSRARKNGFYRLILAKPVDPVWFYGQLFLVHLVGCVLLLASMAALFSLLAFPVAIADIALGTAIAFLLVGGVGFLISAFLNHDSLILVALVALSLLGKSYAVDKSGMWPAFANLLLPIDHLVALKPIIVGGSVATADVLWVVGYGFAALVLGLIAVRYSQLAD
jgi:hypothetical protein